MFTPPITELSLRIKKFQKGLAARDIAGALILENTDLYYFTGRIWPAYLYIPAEGEPVFLNRHRGEIDVPWTWPVVKLDDLNKLANILQEFGFSLSGKVGLELDVLPVLVMQRLQRALPGSDFIDVGRLIRQVRAVKSPWEIDVMRSYSKKDVDLWGLVPEMICQAETDLDIAAAFQFKAREQGQQAIIRLRGFNQELEIAAVIAGEQGALISSYDVAISGVGLGSSYPLGAAGIKLQSGQPIMIDYGSCYSAYIMDHTRMFAVNHLPDQGWHAFNTSLEIQQEMVALAKPGVACGEFFERAREMAEKAGLLEVFMGARGGVPFLGHGVGLEVDELPVLARDSQEVLEEGMVIAIEPKFAIAGVGAIGIENCFLVTKDGVEKLTLAPDDLVVVKK